jgi:hypothetical protein
LDHRRIGFQVNVAKDLRQYRGAKNPKLCNSAQYSKFQTCQTFGMTDQPDGNRLAEVSLMFSASRIQDQLIQTAMNAIVPAGET